MQSRQSRRFVPLNKYIDYEIETTYPHTIRLKCTHKIVKDIINKDLYYMLTINMHKYALHRLIQEQFVHNDDDEHVYVNIDNNPFDLYSVGFYAIKDHQHNFRRYYYSLMKNDFCQFLF